MKTKLSPLQILIKKITFYLLSALFIFSFSDCKTSNSKKITTINNTVLDSLPAAFSLPNPGISYMVIKKGEIVLEKNMGYADIENKIKASSKTNYRLASISKPFTAVAIQKLIHQGKLSYETTISEIFPNFPEYGDNITIAHLLTHRSGIIEYNQFVVDKEQLSDEKVLEGLMSVNTINSQPNEIFAYRNSGYALLAQIIEKITSKEFEDFMNEELFLPAGMKNTSLYQEGKTIPNRAFGYTVEDEGSNKTDQGATTAVKGDGCIYSSLSDLYYWDQALYTDVIIPQSMLNDGLYGFDKNGKTDKKGYGYGWGINYHGDIKIVEHTGASYGFTNHYIRVPSLEISVVVFTNRYYPFYENLNFNNIAYTLLREYSDGVIDLVQ